jgi:hypothetical protein
MSLESQKRINEVIPAEYLSEVEGAHADMMAVSMSASRLEGKVHIFEVRQV